MTGELVKEMVKVTVFCATYNQAPYIEDALKGFVSQKTDFSFEVIVHDDASTDGTADIVERYSERYPDIFKVILQKENQYSKGMSIQKFMQPLARGEYYAWCEGDDYWIDENKLQKQADYLDQNPSCVACCHRAKVLDVSTGAYAGFIGSDAAQDYTADNVGYFSRYLYQTATLMTRKDASLTDFGLQQYAPEVGDYTSRIKYLLLGTIHNIPDAMSVYRRNVPGSWTSRTIYDYKKAIASKERILRMLDAANAVSNGRYDSVFKETERRETFELLRLNRNYRAMIKPVYSDLLKEMTALGRFRAKLIGHLPFLEKPARRLLSILEIRHG